jgi:hypothetical protein
MSNNNNSQGTPIAEPTPTQVGKFKDAPYGICPLISTVQAVVLKVVGSGMPGLSLPKSGLESSEIRPVNLISPCIGTDCQWFQDDWKGCSVRSLARLPSIARAMESPSAQSLEPHIDEMPVILNRLADINEKISQCLYLLIPTGKRGKT